MTNEEFYIKFNFQKLLRIEIDEDDINRISEVLGVKKRFVVKTIARFKKNVQESAAKLFFEKPDVKRKSKTSISFLGDSLTSDRESYFNIIKAAFAQNHNISFDDASRSGNFTSLLLLDFYQEVVYKRPDIVHILIGNNDIRRNKDTHMKNCTSLAEYEENVKYLLKVLKDEDIKAIISTPAPYFNERIEKAFEGTNWYYMDEDYPLYCATVRRAVKEFGGILCDLEAAFSGVDKAVALSEDGLHMSGKGYEIMAETLTPCLVQAINSL